MKTQTLHKPHAEEAEALAIHTNTLTPELLHKHGGSAVVGNVYLEGARRKWSITQ